MDFQPGVHACGITRLSKVVYTCVSADQLGNYIALYEKSATVYLILAKEHRDSPLSHFPTSPNSSSTPLYPLALLTIVQVDGELLSGLGLASSFPRFCLFLLPMKNFFFFSDVRKMREREREGEIALEILSVPFS